MKNYERLFLEHAKNLIVKYENTPDITDKAHMFCGKILDCSKCPVYSSCVRLTGKETNALLTEWLETET